MQDFTLYIDDDRYAVPTVRSLSVASEKRAREWAAKYLEESSHHASVEVCQMGRPLFCLRRPATPGGQTALDEASACDPGGVAP